MLSANVCRSGIALFSRGQTSKVAMRFVHKPNVQSSIKRRQVSKQTRTSVSKSPTATPSTSLKELVVESVSKSRPTAHSRSLKEIFMASAGQRAFSIGKGLALGAVTLGLGALAYYGLGRLSSEPGVNDKSEMWPENVKQRIRATMMYFCGSFAINAASVAAYLHISSTREFIQRRPLMYGIFMPLVIMFGSLWAALNLPYQGGIGAKQVTWYFFCDATGLFFAPYCALLGGPLILRAVICAAGAVVGLSAIAVYAPSKKFLKLGGPLAVGSGVVFTASLANYFLPPVTVLSSGLLSISLCSGLVLMFSAFLLYDTQKIVHDAERHSEHPYLDHPYDPINAALKIYTATINILFRIPMLLFEAGTKKKD